MLPDTLPPLQDLLVELLAARHRLGEQMWTLTQNAPVTKALRELETIGVLGWKHGIVENTYLAWLTDEARGQYMDPEHVPPILAYSCAECGTETADTYVVTTLDPADPKGTRTEVCRACDDKLRTPQLTDRDLELAGIALDSAANSVQSGATLRNRTDLDPLALEYLVAAQHVEKIQKGREDR